MAKLHTLKNQWYRSSVNWFPLHSLVIYYSECPCKFLMSNIFQPAAYTLHMDTHPSSMPPTHYMWSCFFLVYHPYNLRGIPTRDTYVLFNSVTRCISRYFLFPVSNFHSCINMSNGVFKSISNNTMPINLML